MTAAPAPFRMAIAPSRDGLVVAVACPCTWYGLADLCAPEEMPFVLGQARSLQAMHGGTAKHDHIDSHKLATLRRGGMRPTASVSPAERRAPRAVLRRRTPLLRQRTAFLAPSQKTTRPYHLPESGKQRADNATRAGVAERFDAAAVHNTIAGALDLLPSSAARRKARDLFLLKTAKHPAAQTLSL